MENKLQQLTQKLYDEGLEKGRAEADKLVADAKAEARKIVAEARAEAEEIVKKAEAKAEDVSKNTMTEISLAGKQAVGRIKSEIASLIIAKATARGVKEAVVDPAFIKEMLVAVAKNWNGSDSGKVELQALLPEGERKKLDAAFEESAKELLAASGYDTSKPLHLWTSENTARVNTCTVIQQMLAEIGLDIKIDVYEAGTYFDLLESGDQDFFINGWGAVGFPEPDNNIYGPYHSAQIPVNNSMFLRDDKLDEMLTKQRAMEDGPEREALVKDIQKYMRENCFCICLVNTEQVMGIRSNVKNFKPTPAASHFYHMVTFE